MGGGGHSLLVQSKGEVVRVTIYFIGRRGLYLMRHTTNRDRISSQKEGRLQYRNTQKGVKVSVKKKEKFGKKESHI